MNRTNGVHKPVKKKDPTAGLDDGSGVAALMKHFYQALVEDAFQDADDAGLDVSFSLDNPHVQDVLSSLAKNIKGVASTTRDEITALVGRQADEGWSVEELAKQIRDKGAIASRSRALTIARSETARAYSLGSKTAWKISGVVDRVEWQLGPDPCPECESLGGKVVGIDEEFADGIDTPPAHPNCTCNLMPVLAE